MLTFWSFFLLWSFWGFRFSYSISFLPPGVILPVWSLDWESKLFRLKFLCVNAQLKDKQTPCLLKNWSVATIRHIQKTHTSVTNMLTIILSRFEISIAFFLKNSHLIDRFILCFCSSYCFYFAFSCISWSLFYHFAFHCTVDW